MFSKKNAAVGYLVTRYLVPALKKQAKRKAKSTATGAAKNSAKAVRRNPKRTAMVVGTVVGAMGWVLARAASRTDIGKNVDSYSDPKD
jgi:hypothetical protein